MSPLKTVQDQISWLKKGSVCGCVFYQVQDQISWLKKGSVCGCVFYQVSDEVDVDNNLQPEREGVHRDCDVHARPERHQDRDVDQREDLRDIPVRRECTCTHTRRSAGLSTLLLEWLQGQVHHLARERTVWVADHRWERLFLKDRRAR